MFESLEMNEHIFSNQIIGAHLGKMTHDFSEKSNQNVVIKSLIYPVISGSF